MRRWLWIGLIGLVVLLWARSYWEVYAEQGLFIWFGTDFRHYTAQAMALRLGDLETVYSRVSGVKYGQPLVVYSNYPDLVLEATLVPYPPLFAWLFIPFTLPPPPLGFALWTGLNLLAVAYLTWRVASCLPAAWRPWAAFVVVAAFPNGYALYLGQVMILLGCAFVECYLALRAGREFRAGLWLACLLFKPQYGVLLGVLLLWKRRWRVVAGVAAGGAIIAVASLLIVGVQPLLALPAAILDLTERFSGAGTQTHPEDMVNWRKLVRYLAVGIGRLGPWITEDQAVLLTVALSIVTGVLALVAWRGPWVPSEPLFPTTMALLLLATILASYHSHAYGPMLLLAPVATMFAAGQGSRSTRVLLLVMAVLPSLLWVTVFRGYIVALAVLVVACFGALLAEVWLARRAPSFRPS